MPKILGVQIDAVTPRAAYERCQSWLLESSTITGPKVVFTPNPEIITYATKHPEFKSVLAQADLAIPDGIGVVWLARPKLPERVTGTDLMIELLALAEKANLGVGFVLRQQGLSNKTQLAAALKLRWPNLKYQIIYHEETFALNESTQPLKLICVALGCPEQEQWCNAQRHGYLSSARVLLTVGGGVDFLTGQFLRAPSFFRKLGLEWLWRLFVQPQRWRRILTAIIIFPWYVWTKSNKES
ncbi:MAG: hypothetical protein ACD_72C00537G0001 [uncultured bacterium]|nr:MAG: hypothetical protein ACD_72C00537G0001 [uncultured bacterium]